MRLEKLALHLLQSESEKEADVSKAAMLCCHGFGANGTSYEEVLPLFLKSGLASVVLCPDQVGFGLTERPNLVFRRGMSFRTGDQTTLGNLSAPQMYTLPGNAILAGALLDRECELHRNSLIIGHSMGAPHPASFCPWRELRVTCSGRGYHGIRGRSGQGRQRSRFRYLGFGNLVLEIRNCALLMAGPLLQV